MSKRIKQMLISEIRDRIGEARDMLVVDCSGLDAIATNEWRLALRKSEIHAITVKNSLARRALNELGMDGLNPVLEGPSTLIWGGEDIVALSKEIARWAKELEKLEIKGGTIEGETLDAAGVDALSKSPGRPELLSQIAGLALSPGGQLCGALLGPGGTVVGQIKSKAEEDEE